MMEMVLVDLGDDVWVNLIELAAIEPYRDVWGARDDEGGTVIWLKSGEKVRVRHHPVEKVIELWRNATTRVNKVLEPTTFETRGPT